LGRTESRPGKVATVHRPGAFLLMRSRGVWRAPHCASFEHGACRDPVEPIRKRTLNWRGVGWMRVPCAASGDKSITVTGGRSPRGGHSTVGDDLADLSELVAIAEDGFDSRPEFREQGRGNLSESERFP